MVIEPRIQEINFGIYEGLPRDTQGFLTNNSYHFDNNEGAIKRIKEIINSDDRILIKASNSLNFKEIVDSLKGEI